MGRFTPRNRHLLAMSLMLSFCAVYIQTSFGSSFHQEEDKLMNGKEPDIELKEPQEEFSFEGGSFRIWRTDVSAFSDKRIDVTEITFEEDGLLLPQYADADGIAYVIQGTGKLGIVTYFEGLPIAKIRRVEPGHIVSIPKGSVFWWYNDGYGMHRIFCASDTVEGTDPGLYHQFTLAGAKAKRFGGLLHGFSTAALASVWNVDEDTVRHFLENQNSTSFVKSPRRIKLPDPRWISCDTQAETKPRNNMQIAEFTYNMNSKYPDFSVRSGGWKKEVDDGSLPVLQKVGMSASMVGLEPNAMEAPLFFSNANQLVYILNGSGRLEVSSSNGETLLAREVRPGMIFAIPKFLPSIKVAGDTGLSFLTLLTSSRPHCSYLIGMSSPYENVPKQVMAEALNIDESSLSELLANRKHDHIIFPPADIMVERKH